MTRTTLTRTINAPIDKVFDTIAQIRNFAEAVPDIVNVEFLSGIQVGVGTRFRETRARGKRQQSHELEVTEYQENDRVRIVTDSHGTVWDTLFTVREVSGGTQLTMVMDARAHRLLPRIINPLLRPLIAKAIEGDLDAVKLYCEG